MGRVCYGPRCPVTILMTRKASTNQDNMAAPIETEKTESCKNFPVKKSQVKIVNLKKFQFVVNEMNDCTVYQVK